jgi:hypothetical protein
MLIIYVKQLRGQVQWNTRRMVMVGLLTMIFTLNDFHFLLGFLIPFCIAVAFATGPRVVALKKTVMALIPLVAGLALAGVVDLLYCLNAKIMGGFADGNMMTMVRSLFAPKMLLLLLIAIVIVLGIWRLAWRIPAEAKLFWAYLVCCGILTTAANIRAGVSRYIFMLCLMALIFAMLGLYKFVLQRFSFGARWSGVGVTAVFVALTLIHLPAAKSLMRVYPDDYVTCGVNYMKTHPDANYVTDYFGTSIDTYLLNPKARVVAIDRLPNNSKKSNIFQNIDALKNREFNGYVLTNYSDHSMFTSITAYKPASVYQCPDYTFVYYQTGSRGYKQLNQYVDEFVHGG